MGSGKMTRLMALESTLIQMVLNTRVTGLMTNSMDKAKKSGLTGHNMKAITNLAKKMVEPNVLFLH